MEKIEITCSECKTCHDTCFGIPNKYPKIMRKDENNLFYKQLLTVYINTSRNYSKKETSQYYYDSSFKIHVT